MGDIIKRLTLSINMQQTIVIKANMKSATYDNASGISLIQFDMNG